MSFRFTGMSTRNLQGNWGPTRSWEVLGGQEVIGGPRRSGNQIQIQPKLNQNQNQVEIHVDNSKIQNKILVEMLVEILVES